MIAFSRLGEYGRFGNQLFQYAFLRTTAQRLGVKFYCPPWLGDRLFILNDEGGRAKEMPPLTKVYSEPKNNCGFNQSALGIQDNTDILGYFQTEKYFDKNTVKKWYTFREDMVYAAKEKYRDIDFSKSTAMHLRFGDNKNKPVYVIPLTEYYRRSLAKVKNKENILVFSDEIDLAEKQLKDAVSGLAFMGGNKDYEDFYLMSLCRDFICSVSTFSWWPAWLSRYDDGIVVCPKEWIRPGYTTVNNDLTCEGWFALKTCRSIIDSYPSVKLRNFLKNLGLMKKEFYEAG